MNNQYAFLTFMLTILTIAAGNAQKIGLQTQSPQHNVHITQPANTTLSDNQSVLYTEYTGTNDVNVIGIRAKSKPVDGRGIGGYFEGGTLGLFGLSTGADPGYHYGIRAASAGSGTCVGLFTESYGDGVNYGIYATADEGTVNWAGYFEQGNVYMQNRLGLGQPTPLHAIDILKPQAVVRMMSESTTNGSVLELRNTTASPNYLGAINFGNEVTTSGQIGYLGTHHMAFRVGNVERMRIGQDRMGIFNSSPQHPVHVNQPAGTLVGHEEAVMHVEYTGSNGADAIAVRGISKPLDYYGIGGFFVGGYVGVRGKVDGTGTNSYYAVLGEADGPQGTKYGIFAKATGGGTNWAGYFQGNVHITSSLGIGRDPGTNNLEVEGTASKTTPGDWIGNSDARLKKNIQSLDPSACIQQLLSLQGISYEWNDNKTGSTRPEGIQYGFTAQNVQEIFPELVQTDAKGYLQTSYGTYDAMMIEAIRYLYSENQALKNELAEFRAHLGK